MSPSVMHNTLIGQCFHTRNEKIHKDIFGLFQPFLQVCVHNGDVCFYFVMFACLGEEEALFLYLHYLDV